MTRPFPLSNTNAAGKHVAIIGAGPAGLTAAYQLAKSGVSVDVFEAENTVGGLCRTIALWGQKVDLGPHRFFSSDPRVNRLWLEIVGKDYAMVDRLTRIHYKNKFFNYPLRPIDTFSNLGVVEVIRCVASYTRQQLSNAPSGDSFEDWVVQRFGRRLFEIFFKTYSEKLWGITCKELDADFAAQRIKKLSLYEAIKGAVMKRNSGRHRTLIDRFAYPLGGTGMVYERMAESIQRWGGTIHFQRPIRRITIENSKVQGLETMGGDLLPFDAVVSTMPLTLLVKSLPNVPPSVREAIDSLRFRNTILVFLNVEKQDLFRDNWLYVHSAELRMGRVTNFRNWVPQLYGTMTSSILALEFWCNDVDPLWTEDDAQLIQRGENELRATGLIKDAAVSGGHVHRIKRCYPVYQRGYKGKVTAVAKYLKSLEHLTVIGRYGSFKYNNQDHSILMGLLCAENLLSDRRHDLWGVNTDYETYQEATIITETGLEQLPAHTS